MSVDACHDRVVGAKMALNGSTDEPYPDKTDSPPNVYEAKGFRISTQKLPILKAGPIEEMTGNLGIAPPEMIFGDNFVSIEHVDTGWSITFNAFDALDMVDKTGQSMLQVAHSDEWQRSRYEISQRCRMKISDAFSESTTMRRLKKL